jgi:hypothetical protein
MKSEDLLLVRWADVKGETSGAERIARQEQLASRMTRELQKNIETVKTLLEKVIAEKNHLSVEDAAGTHLEPGESWLTYMWKDHQDDKLHLSKVKVTEKEKEVFMKWLIAERNVFKMVLLNLTELDKSISNIAEILLPLKKEGTKWVSKLGISYAFE